MCKTWSKCHNSDIYFSGARIINEGESVQHNPIPQYNRLDKDKYMNYTRYVNIIYNYNVKINTYVNNR